ncbi:MAG: hypothetical protein Unbinned1469contig1000_35 [Prokaryotic dsDNA virus sp.]|jgi:hypothetical protein|nr:MAG: hypothetical protein Unbinned1469contig1000_35 [Prokaryotic dsDNA virus sp.]|tara:strand:+ start:2168 stop:2713 length:546 start_codon:yes stop_codon:yes gene_type:complete
MIVECLIFFSSFTDPNTQDFDKAAECFNHLPSSVIEYSDHYLNYFYPKNQERAVKVSWCESRGKTYALNKGNSDSGLFQVIPRTWDWVAEEYNLPKFDTEVLTFNGMPVNHLDLETRKILLFWFPNLYELTKVQFIPHYNFLISSIIVQDIHSRDDYWKAWTPSIDCWSSNDWEELWKLEE